MSISQAKTLAQPAQNPAAQISVLENDIKKCLRESTTAPIGGLREKVSRLGQRLGALQEQLRGAQGEVLENLEMMRQDYNCLRTRVGIVEAQLRKATPAAPVHVVTAHVSHAPAPVVAPKPKLLCDIRAPEFHPAGGIRRSIGLTVLEVIGHPRAYKDGPYTDLTAEGLILDFGKAGLPHAYCNALYKGLLADGYPADSITAVGRKIVIEHSQSLLFIGEKCKFDAFQIWELLCICFADEGHIQERSFPEKEFLELVKQFRTLCDSRKIEGEADLVREIDTWEIGIAKALRAAAVVRGVAAKDLPQIPACENHSPDDIQSAADLAKRYAREMTSHALIRSGAIPTNGSALIAEIAGVLDAYDEATLEKLSGEIGPIMLKMDRYNSIRFNAQYDETSKLSAELDALQHVLQDTLLYQRERLMRPFLELGSVVGSGRDSRNRELVTDRHLVELLSNPGILLAVFAHKALMKKKGAGDHDDTNRQLTEMAAMLFYGLRDQHPVVLETMPVNRTFALASKGRIHHLTEYVRRKNIQQTFVPVLRALAAIHKDIVKKPCTVVCRSRLDQPYEMRKWSEYARTMEPILKTIDPIKAEKLLESASGTPFDRFVFEFRSGLGSLMKIQGKDLSKMTFDEVIESILTSHEILDQNVAHLFCDALHLLAAMKETDPCIKLKDGAAVSPRDIVLGIYKRLGSSWKGDYTIAAEQFYVRLMLIADKLKI